MLMIDKNHRDIATFPLVDVLEGRSSPEKGTRHPLMGELYQKRIRMPASPAFDFEREPHWLLIWDTMFDQEKMERVGPALSSDGQWVGEGLVAPAEPCLACAKPPAELFPLSLTLAGGHLDTETRWTVRYQLPFCQECRAQIHQKAPRGFLPEMPGVHIEWRASPRGHIAWRLQSTDFLRKLLRKNQERLTAAGAELYWADHFALFSNAVDNSAGEQRFGWAIAAVTAGLAALFIVLDWPVWLPIVAGIIGGLVLGETLLSSKKVRRYRRAVTEARQESGR